MRTRLLGRTGVTVSEYCLGAMMYGAMGNRDADDCIRQIHTALDAGINFIDTADVYSRGESEEIVGRAIAGRRDDVVLATKFFAQMHDTDPNQRGASRRWIVREVEASLRRLGTDHIDLYQCHRFPEDSDPEEAVSALTDLQRAGKIRYWGTSSWPAERLVEAHWTADRRGLTGPRCEQAPYNLLTRGIERAVLPTCHRYGMGVICYSPLAGSWLSGRYRTTEDLAPDTRLARLGARWGGFDPESEQNQRRLEVVRRCQAVADEAGLPLAHLAVAWTLEHPTITSTIIGPRTMEQLQDLLAAAEVVLDADVLDALDRVVAPGTNVNAGDPSSDPITLRASHRRRPSRP